MIDVVLRQGIGALALRSWRSQAALPGVQPPVWAFVQPFKQSSAASADSISQRQALHLIQTWQTAKSAALGERSTRCAAALAHMLKVCQICVPGGGAHTATTSK